MVILKFIILLTFWSEIATLFKYKKKFRSILKNLYIIKGISTVYTPSIKNIVNIIFGKTLIKNNNKFYYEIFEISRTNNKNKI